MDVNWHSSDIGLDLNWHQIGSQVASDWISIGIRLYVNWHSSDIGLDLNWHWIGSQLAVDCTGVTGKWLPIGRQVASDWRSIGIIFVSPTYLLAQVTKSDLKPDAWTLG